MAKGAAIAKSFIKDGAGGKSNRQLASTRQERDFWRWVKLPLDAYSVELPLYSRDSIHKQVVLETVSLVLMSDMLNYIYSLNKEMGILLSHPDSLRSWWENEHDGVYLRDLGFSKSELISQRMSCLWYFTRTECRIGMTPLLPFGRGVYQPRRWQVRLQIALPYVR